MLTLTRMSGRSSGRIIGVHLTSPDSCSSNAQGKSNLLEAIELLATGKSARASTERELIHWDVAAAGPSSGLAFARISAVVAQPNGETRAEVLLRLTDPADDAGTPMVSKTYLTISDQTFLPVCSTKNMGPNSCC